MPYRIALFNKRVTNRFIEPLVGRLPGFARVHHVGRSSQASYTTPVLAFRHDDAYLVALTYGPNVDWLKNVQRGPATLETRGQPATSVVTTELRSLDEVRGSLPLPVRLTLRLLRVGTVAQLRVAPKTQPHV